MVEIDGQLFHWKYQWDKVHPTSDGHYAACDDPYLFLREINKRKVERPLLKEIEFEPPVILRVSDYRYAEDEKKEFPAEMVLENELFVNEYFTSPMFDAKGDTAICKMGAYPDALFHIKAETVIYWRLRREACEKSLGIAGFYSLDSPQYEASNKCAADLKAKGVLE